MSHRFSPRFFFHYVRSSYNDNDNNERDEASRNTKLHTEIEYLNNIEYETAKK